MDINDFSIAELEQSAWEDSDYPSYVVQKVIYPLFSVKETEADSGITFVSGRTAIGDTKQALKKTK